MISVLIPVYNTDVRTLVTSLQKQLQKEAVPYEILLLDDASSVAYVEVNRQLKEVPFCTIEERSINKGRLETRRELAHIAQYPWLLFIDSDCIIEDNDYISNYKSLLRMEYDVIIGGTNYNIQEPEDCSLRLHWKYANQRIRTYSARPKKSPYNGFLFNNVIFRKALFNELWIPDFFEGYGHEDTYIGIALEQRKATLHFIENPVLHPQLDKSDIFLRKNLEALNNIKYLLGFNESSTLKQHIKIYRYHLFLKKAKLIGLFDLFIKLAKKRMKRNLVGCRPSLFYFDLLRLHYLNTII